jgi:two-component system phosphate regulon response regulator PhoB
MPGKEILVVDDEEDILELVRYNLAKQGYGVSCVTSGEKALCSVREKRPDLILLDLMLPGVDGFQVTRILKADPQTAEIPIAILSARGEEADVVAGIELGAEDYITKPFSPRILLARVRAILRRQSEAIPSSGSALKIQDLFIDPGRHQVSVQGDPVTLTRSEFLLLHMLARRPGWVFTRNQIIDSVRGEDCPVTDRSVDVHVVGLRKKLGLAGQLIETIRGVGYRFKETET